MDKKQLRQRLRERLSAIPSHQRGEKSRAACRNLVSTPQFQKAKTVMLYLSLPQEADVSEAIQYGWRLGKKVCAPDISRNKDCITPVLITSMDSSYSTSVSGLRNPVNGVPIPIEKIDLVVAPALGFDRCGNRLGRGGSYYDRFFANAELKALKCGFGFTVQVVDSVPMTATDVPVDFLVTDEEVIYCNQSIVEGE